MDYNRYEHGGRWKKPYDNPLAEPHVYKNSYDYFFYAEGITEKIKTVKLKESLIRVETGKFKLKEIPNSKYSKIIDRKFYMLYSRDPVERITGSGFVRWLSGESAIVVRKASPIDIVAWKKALGGKFEIQGR